MALAVVVPITVTGVTVVNLLIGEVERRGSERLALAAGVAERDLDARAARVGAVLERLAAADVPRALAAGDPGQAVAESLVASELDVLVVSDAGGKVVAEARRPSELANPPSATALLGGGGADVAILARTDLPGGGTVVGGQWLDGARLRQVLRTEEVELAVVGDRGRVLASTARVAKLAAVSVAGPTGELSLDLSGRRWLVAAAPVPGSDALLVTVVRPPNDTSPAELLLVLGALVAVVLVLILLVAQVVSGLVTAPVHQLVSAADAVAGGDLDQAVEARGDREIAELGRAFNRMTENLRDHVHRLEESRREFRLAIARLGDVLVSTHDLDGILGAVLEAAVLTTGAERAVFWERIAMPARLRVRAAHGADLGGAELNGDGLAGVAGRRLAVAVHPGADPLHPSEPAVEAAMAVPVQSGGRLYGVLALYGRGEPGPFPAEAADTLQTLARQAEVAIGNVMLHDETRHLARTDGLTGLWNRREFELRCQDAIRQAARFDESLGVLVVDVDDFKLVNDRFDHSTGDAALVWVAARLDDATREVDVVARWGGEEFIVLLPRASAEDTATVAERIRSSIAEAPMVHDGLMLPLTVSVGTATFPLDGTTGAELFQAADAALLRAKRTGKNRVERAGSEEVA